MSFLLSLPAELQQRVLDFVHPGDIPSFSASCKLFQTLAQARLTEHKRFADVCYKGRMRIFRFNHKSDTDTLPFPKGSARMLVNIAENPRIAWYIESLEGQGWEAPVTVFDKTEKSADGRADRDVVRQLIHASPFIHDDERQDWMQAFHDGEGGALLALLLSQLPRLKQLLFEDTPRDLIIPYVTRMITRLAARSHRGYLGQPLSALETVRIHCRYGSGRHIYEMDSYDEEIESEPLIVHPAHFVRLLKALTTLPNVTHLSLRDYFSYTEDEERDNPVDRKFDMDHVETLDPSYPLISRPSQLNSITIDGGSVSASALSFILKDCSTLEHFRYMVYHTDAVFGSALLNRAPSPDYTIASICKTLLTHAHSSLRSLHVEMEHFAGRCGCRHDPCLNTHKPYTSIDPDSPPTTNWNLHQFTSLETLTLDIELFGPKSGGWLPFAETLPVSVKEVCIVAEHVTPGAEEADVQAMLRAFRPQSFPNLHTLIIFHGDGTNYITQEHNGVDHILPIYKSTVAEAGIPPANLQDYYLPHEYFAAPRRKFVYPHDKMGQSGRPEWEIHALPPEDTTGHLIMGVHHANEDDSLHWKDRFDGVRVKKTW